MGADTGGETGAGAAMRTGAGMGAGAGTGAAAAWREPEPRRADSAADAATGATAAAAANTAAVWERMAGPLRHLHSTVLRRGFGRPLLSDGGPEREGEPARGRSGGGCRALDRLRSSSNEGAGAASVQACRRQTGRRPLPVGRLAPQAPCIHHLQSKLAFKLCNFRGLARTHTQNIEL